MNINYHIKNCYGILFSTFCFHLEIVRLRGFSLNVRVWACFKIIANRMAIKSGAMGQSNMREIKKRIISGNRARFLQLAAFLKKTSKKCNSKWSYNYGGVSDKS